MIVREVLYQLDVLASKIPLEGSFEGDTFSEKQKARSVLNDHKLFPKYIEMNLFSFTSDDDDDDDDLIGIAVDENSMVLPKELFEVIGSPSSELDQSSV